ncbi:DsbA family oxidoreductase [Halovulum dunhuangense]|uniref:DsbA family oxidoreductase n=1 Tax=Halovulum dunhuangense TaxID=1505036 RepID=A0A849L3J1_9RHOB|nr:DsbA family oxidoreductase [Halovulum dunhuangense]NNU80731.1 DsbA family oxidoreductase [Halovulum dunhuangense]
MTTTLDIISDPICPWCHIGKARLDRALEARPGHPFLIRWRPFQLNPDMPPEGADRRTYLETKFGGPERAAQVYARINDVATESGLDLDFERISRTPNTLDAHRLLRWAGVEGRQSLVANQLFHRYFVNGEDIGAHSVLVDVASSTGLDPDMVARLLAGDADKAEVLAEDQAARDMGVTGVPTFIIGGRYVVTGAQESATWLKIIDELIEKTEELSRSRP